MSKRIVITGIGVLAPNGIGKENFWKAIEAGRSGVSPIEAFDVSALPTKIAGEIKHLDATGWIDAKTLRRIDRNAQFAVGAAKQAIQESGLDVTQENIAASTGIVIGTAIGGQNFMLEQDKVLIAKGPMKISPYSALNSFPDACAGQVAIELGLKGPSFAVSTACSSALDAIGLSVDLIRSGKADFIVTGGSEAPLSQPILASFCVVRALSTNNADPASASRPFDKTRDGFVMGEGAGMMVLEEYEHAKKRGALIYGEILGHGMTCDAYHMTAPHPEGVEQIRAVHLALKNSGISPEEIDYINAHGTSTPLNDKMETLVIKSVFKDRAKQIPVSATKSMIGHLIGAAGGVELIASLLGMQAGVIPPTINYETPDPECDLDYVPREARKKKIRTFMKNSFGFGGKNSVLVVRKV